MITDMENAAFVLAVAAAIGALRPDQHTDVCPDCGRRLYHYDNDEHLVVDVTHLPNPTRDVAVVVGCQGNWAVDPALVGLTAPAWHPAPRWPGSTPS